MTSVLRSHPLQSNKRRLEAESTSTKKQKRLHAELRLEIPPLKFPSTHCSTDDDPLFTPASSGETSSRADSLFGEETAFSTGRTDNPPYKETIASASRTAPPIPGFFFNPAVEVSYDIGARVLAQCMETYFQKPDVNQIMLFGRAPSPGTPESTPASTSFPPILNELLTSLSNDLREYLPPATYDLLFPASPRRARQAIINLYHPGEGISSHVDLLGRFGDGIIGVSFGSGCVMQFDRVHTEVESRGEPSVDHTPADATTTCNADPTEDRYDLYLPERSVIVLSGDSRYKWTHGIARRADDVVGTETFHRGTRMSITFRWLLPGAEIVGDTVGPDI
ncbi:hypothetical protein PLEOSDRAFT_1089246 [Pleurotus ostreatus PC15]|uniref:Fe2OG dioxygenase domain-containing protein n=2 Tax=Pleurotus TaxID=5320 RepID=A0A067P1N9_PLEO1|nr:hypothetical protein CCMSSC00406_0001296 [Pleurotus cornucopiae]KDQ29771.1 hypothetical protein PLEOSDRAFT_1089246 [Pleurotus ostreatus PC15]